MRSRNFNMKLLHHTTTINLLSNSRRKLTNKFIWRIINDEEPQLNLPGLSSYYSISRSAWSSYRVYDNPAIMEHYVLMYKYMFGILSALNDSALITFKKYNQTRGIH